uniref:Core-2/I-Branching enzyme n=1 Tax=Panagrolaimus superbus TaxID=310955 RepID=A0A914YG43_9BILA
MESSIQCDAIFAGDQKAVEKAKKWQFPFQDVTKIWKKIEESHDQCLTLKKYFVFPDLPLSIEEAEFPLAYGALVHKDITQVTYLLSSIYRSNNVYAFVVDGKASIDFKRRINLLSDCLPNVYVQHTTVVKWCGYEIVRSVFNALRLLANLKQEWKYFQYLSGVDLPLKTNLEMTRIFNELNGAFISEVSEFQNRRLRNISVTSPLPLFKSSLSATFSRASADYMISSPIVSNLLSYLKNTKCPDESIWATIAGSPDLLPLPGGFNASALLTRRRKEIKEGHHSFIDPKITRPNNNTFVPTQYYISRYQVWKPSSNCKGKYVASSCVFGVDDLSVLISRPELVVHKLYFDFQPATYFCLLRHHWQRSLNIESQQYFKADSYMNLAQVVGLLYYF